MLKIGLTGGIGSGKSAASAHFVDLGAAVIDTDVISRQLVEPGQPALEEIAAEFGDRMLGPDGRLDRAALGKRVFADTDARRRLEAILHPRIRDEMFARAKTTDAPYVVFVIPLLIETGQQALVDRVLVIDTPEPLQRTRVAARDHLDDAHIDAILAAQVARTARLEAADDVILNDGSIAELHAAVERLHRQYLRQIQH